MNTRILAGAAALAVAVSPAALSAQGAINSVDDKRPEMTTEQTAIYEAWPDDRRATYDAWTPEYQTYYWTLDPAQQDGWWVLNTDQRAQVYAMTPPQRTAAWNSITAQMNAAPATQATTSATTTSTMAVNFESKPMVQQVPQTARTGEYPLCQGDTDDACINPWAAGERGKGVTRPLDYWPGKPASS